jgi:hypothetical protein
MPAPTPPKLYEALVRVGGDVDAISDKELDEIGVSREHAEGFTALLRDLAAASRDPLAASGDDLSSFDYWLKRYDEKMARGDTSW